MITGRVVLHKKFYKKFHLPVIKNGRLFRQKTSFGGWIYYSRGEKKWTFFRLISIEKVKNYLLIQKDNSLTFFMRQKEGNVFFKICHFLITGRVVLHKKFYKKNFIYQLSKMEDYLGKKTSFWWLDLLFSGWKNEHFFDWFQSKVKNYLLIQKDNSLTFFMRQKEGNVFFKIQCHFLITGRVVLHKKFYKKFHLPVIKNGRLFRQKNFFGGWIYYSRGEKMNIFSIDFNRKWRIIF